MWRPLTVLAIGLGLACSGGAVDSSPDTIPVETPGPDPDPEQKSKGEPVPQPGGQGHDPSIPQPALPSEEGAGRAVVMSRDRLERELSEVDGVDDVIRFRPNVTVRGIDGFKVTAIPKGSPIEGIGLLPGDVVHKVNGHQLTSLGAVMAAAEELQTADHYSGVITRNGKRQTITVQLQ